MDGNHMTDVKIGRVVAVSGSNVEMMLESGGPGSRPLVSPQIGALVKMQPAGATVFGIVTSLGVRSVGYGSDAGEIQEVKLQLLGEVVARPDGGEEAFQRGVSAFPSLGDGVYATTKEDLAKVYAKPAVSTVRIGTIHQDRRLPGYVITDDLLGKHFAILGTTGSGKSCTVALIMHAILSRYSNGHVVLLDPHNEYSQAFGKAAEVIGPDTSTAATGTR